MSRCAPHLKIHDLVEFEYRLKMALNVNFWDNNTVKNILLSENSLNRCKLVCPIKKIWQLLGLHKPILRIGWLLPSSHGYCLLSSPFFHVMAHGQKNKSLTLHHQSSTRQHKKAKSTTSQAVPLDKNVAPLLQPQPLPKLCTRPCPLVHNTVSLEEEKDKSKADAAQALISMQNCTNTVLNSPPASDQHR